MSPLREASLTALREIRRNLASAKGIAMFVFFFLGGSLPVVAELVIIKILGRDPLAGVTPEETQQAYEQALLYTGRDAATAHYLSFCPPQLLLNPGDIPFPPFLFQGTVVFTPLLILLIGFEQVAGDIQYRAIRYIAGRSRRESIVVGKALGLWAVIALLTLVLNVTVWILMLARGSGSPLAILAWGPRLWLFQVIAAAAWVGLITLISSCVRTPNVALFIGVVAFPMIWLANVILSRIDSTKAVTWALPFRYADDLLLSPEPLRVMGGMAAFIGWGAVMVAVAALIVKRRDV
jgi:ABC-type transport system involved in multi-copper enzyme maturation permease subunit